MHVRNSTFLVVAIFVTANAVLAVPTPAPPASPENKQSNVDLWPLMGIPLLGLPFLMPGPDPCITQALKTRAKNIEAFNKNARQNTDEPWPQWYTTLNELVKGCEALYRSQGKAKTIDVSKHGHQDIFEDGLVQCIRNDCHGRPRSVETQDDWQDKKNCILRCKMWWKLDPIPDPTTNKKPNAGDRLNSVMQQAGDKLSHFVGGIMRATEGESQAGQGSKPFGGGPMIPGGMMGARPAFAGW
ncbi:MAG: hypothetical protein M1816_002543 [Peltula sp. TS41687]|nr:MAG: hypothetical protein M1816_002543 [Peltula sp. TS41687]